MPDTNDRHVQAAAIKGQAQMIITYNLKDFPQESLKKYGMEAQHPDDFLLNQTGLHLPAFLTAIKTCRTRLKNPPKTPQEYLDILRKHSLIKTADFLGNFIDLI